MSCRNCMKFRPGIGKLILNGTTQYTCSICDQEWRLIEIGQQGYWEHVFADGETLSEKAFRILDDRIPYPLPYGAGCPYQYQEDGTCGHDRNTTPECHEDACPLVTSDVRRKTTDELLEKLPDHLHLARNKNADVIDRWRVYNSCTKKYVGFGASTARELLVRMILARKGCK